MIEEWNWTCRDQWNAVSFSVSTARRAVELSPRREPWVEWYRNAISPEGDTLRNGGRNHFAIALHVPSPRRGGLGRGDEWQINSTIPPLPGPPRRGEGE